VSIIFGNDIPPLHQGPNIDVAEFDVYCECPVYGPLPNIQFVYRKGQPFQLFRRTATISRRERYLTNSLAKVHEGSVRALIEDVKNARMNSDYAIGLPEEFILRKSNGSVVRLPQSIYHTLKP